METGDDIKVDIGLMTGCLDGDRLWTAFSGDTEANKLSSKQHVLKLHRHGVRMKRSCSIELEQTAVGRKWPWRI